MWYVFFLCVVGNLVEEIVVKNVGNGMVDVEVKV